MSKEQPKTPTPIQVPGEIIQAAYAAEQVKQRNAKEAEEADLVANNKAKLATALISNMEPDGSQPETGGSLKDKVLMRLLESLESDMDEKRVKKAAELDAANRLRKAQHQNIQIEQAAKHRAQEACPHTKENGRTRVGGQRLSNNHTQFICTFCFKEFDETTLPPHLHPSFDTIGG